jgi:adenylosuccinate lyase
VIGEHAVAVAVAMREKGASNDLLDRLAEDSRLPLDQADLAALLADHLSFTGAAAEQVAVIVSEVGKLVARHPDAAAYRPAVIL